MRGLTPAPVISQSAPLTLVASQTAWGEREGVVCPADRVADIAGECVQAVDVNLHFQSGEVPRCPDHLTPSVPSITHITTSGDQAGQSHLALPRVQGLPLTQHAGLLDVIWKQRF